MSTFTPGPWPPPLPVAGEVHLWWLDLDPPAEQVAAAFRLLDADEVERARRFKFDRHRRRFTLRRAQLRRLCGAYLGIDPRDVRYEIGERGKPRLAQGLVAPLPDGLEFNLSDSADVAVVGFKIGGELGVDVEVVRPMEDAVSISRSFFADAEQRVLSSVSPAHRDDTFFRCWTRKEAYIKAVGEGLHLPLDSFTVTMTRHEAPRFLSFVGHPGEEERWTLEHFEPVPGVFVAVAVRRLDLRFSFFRPHGAP